MQMQSGLHGKLEELGLDEILQIVGVSRRTGIPTPESRGREAVPQFRDGPLAVLLPPVTAWRTVDPGK